MKLILIDSKMGSETDIGIPPAENHRSPKVQTKGISGPAKTVSKKTGTILFIDDNIPNIELVEEILSGHRPGIRFIVGMNGRQGAKLAMELVPGLILLDLDLPGVPGYKLLSDLSANEKTKLIPVVIISSDTFSGQQEKLMKAGASDYLAKPLDVAAFLLMVDKWLK